MDKMLRKLWANKKQIIEGIKNSITRDETIEKIADYRLDICKNCTSMGNKCLVKKTAPCCNECGCSLKFKTRSLSSECPLKKWKIVLTEKQLSKLEDNDNY